MSARKLNRRLLVWTLAVLASMGCGVHLLHGGQTLRHARLLREEAEEAQAAGESERAASRWGRYLQLAPDDVEALVKYAAILEHSIANRASRWRVISVLRQALVREPSHQEARRRLATLLMEQSAYDEARKHLEILTNARPSDGILAVAYGRSLEALGEFDQAAIAYENAITVSPHDFDGYMRLADMLLRRQLPLKAADILDRLVEANPDNALALLMRGRHRFAHGASEAAHQDFAAALEQAPRDPEVLRENSIAAQARGDLVRARQLWMEHVEVCPQDQSGYLALAALDAEGGDWNNAVETLDWGLERIPNDPSLLQFQAELCIAYGDHKRAEELIARFEQDSATRTRAAYLRGLELIHNQKMNQAVQVLEGVRRARDAAPDLVSRAWEGLGQIAGELGDPDEQLTAYRQALDANPASLSARLGYAAALTSTGQIEDALKHYRHLASLPGTPPAARAGLCRVLIRKNLLLPLASRDWREVEVILNQIGAKVRDKQLTAVLRAETATARDQPHVAQAILNEACREGTMTLPLCHALANCAAVGGDLNAARRMWLEMLKHEKDRVPATLACVAFWERWGGPNATAVLAELELAVTSMAEPDQLRLLRRLALANFRMERLTHAERLARQVAARQPEDLANWGLLLDVAVETGRPDMVAELLPAIRRLEGVDGTWQLYGEAALAYLRGNAEAPQLLTELAGRRPTWSRVAMLEARLATQQGNNKRALDSLVQCMKLSELRPAFVYRTSRLLAEWGRFTEADEAIARLQFQANLGRDFSQLAAEIAFRAGNPERAVTLARHAATADSVDYRDHIWRGRLLAAAGRRHLAEEAFRRAVQLAGHSPDAWTALAGFLADADRMDNAETVLAEAARALPPENRLLAAAMGAEALHRWSRADACYQESLAAQPNDPLVLHRAARFYLRVDQPRQVELLLRRLLAQSLVLSNEEMAWARLQLALLHPDNREATALLDRNHQDGRPEAVATQRARAFIAAFQPENRGGALRLLMDSLAPSTMTADEQFRLARLAVSADDWPAAREQMLALLARDKTNPAYLAQLIQWLLDRQNMEDAALWMARFEKAAPDDPRTQALQEQFKSRLAP